MSDSNTPPKDAFVFKTWQNPKQMFADSGDDSDDKRPVRLTAFTGKPVKHWWWGPCIFDRKGFAASGDQITIDFNHNPDEELGFLDEFSGDPELICTGYLLPFGKDTAAKIIHRTKRGRKYQCSVTVDEYLRTEELEEGATAEVNGMIVKGPIRIFREYSIMGVALCSYATDKGTETQIFNNQRKESELIMPEQTKEPVASVATDDRTLFKTFCTLYGTERAAKYFSDGLTEGQAKDRYITDVTTDLKKFSDESDEKDEKIAELEAKIEELEKEDDDKKDNKDKDHAARISALEAENAQLKAAAAGFKAEESPLSGNQQQPAEKPQYASRFSDEKNPFAAQLKKDLPPL